MSSTLSQSRRRDPGVQRVARTRLSATQVRYFRAYGADVIARAGITLKVRQNGICAAQLLYQGFFKDPRAFLQYDLRKCAAASLFLGAKLYDMVINVHDLSFVCLKLLGQSYWERLLTGGASSPGDSTKNGGNGSSSSSTSSASRSTLTSTMITLGSSTLTSTSNGGTVGGIGFGAVGNGAAALLFEAAVKVFGKEVTKYERNLLVTRGFRMADLMDVPHKFILQYLAVLLGDLEDEDDDPGGPAAGAPPEGCDAPSPPQQVLVTRALRIAVARRAWGYLNDVFRSDACCRFSPHEIAAAAIWLTCREANLKLPQDWLKIYDCELEEVEKIAKHIRILYD